ncbi:MAG: PD-(D/E)XK nuclease family protein, partial [Deltaproteobacteria bacterium]
SIEGAENATDEDAGDDTSLWAHAAAVARTLEQLLIARPAGERMTQQALMQLHDLAVGNGSDLAAFTGESGRPALASSPGAVTTPSAEVVWWGFVLDADPGPPPEPWTSAEREALLGAGVTLPVPGERRDVEAEGWRRPVLAARERLVLVRWRLSATDPIAPHALFDELSTRVTADSLPACTVASDRVLAIPSAVSHWNAATCSVAPRTLMAQRAIWTVPPESVDFTARLSASALEVYLGCPFRWALENKARLRRGAGVTVPEGSQLLGMFAHRILQDMLCGSEKLSVTNATAAQARAWATRAFDERVGVEAAPLVRRGREVELDRARTLVANAAGALVDFLRTSGWLPVDAEREVEGTFAGQPAHGYVDLVVEKNGVEALVDLKLSGLRYRQEELEEGRGLQLALYASMLKKGGKGLPPSGFFILEDGQLITTEPQAFPGATVVEGPGPKATLEGSAEGFLFWRKVLAAGVLPVLHEDLSWEGPVTAAGGTPPDEDSLARREPPCRYCDYQAICEPPDVDDEEVAP